MICTGIVPVIDGLSESAKCIFTCGCADGTLVDRGLNKSKLVTFGLKLKLGTELGWFCGGIHCWNGD